MSDIRVGIIGVGTDGIGTTGAGIVGAVVGPVGVVPGVYVTRGIPPNNNALAAKASTGKAAGLLITKA